MSHYCEDRERTIPMDKEHCSLCHPVPNQESHRVSVYHAAGEPHKVFLCDEKNILIAIVIFQAAQNNEQVSRDLAYEYYTMKKDKA